MEYETPTADPPADALRWTDVCRNCAYSLRTLPDSGKCPECGTAYDVHEILLYGWGCGTHASLTNVARGEVRGRAIGVAVSIAMSCFFFGWRSGGVRLAVLLLTCARGVWVYWQRQVSHPGLVQVRLRDTGFIQYDSVKPSLALNWFNALTSLIVPFAVPCVALFYYRAAHSAAFWIWMGLSVLAWLAVPAGIRRLRRLRAYSDSSSNDLNSALSGPTPWSDLHFFQIELLGPDLIGLKIAAKPVFFDRIPVDAKLKCDAEHLHALYHRLKQWGKDATGFSSLSEGAREAIASRRPTPEPVQ
jgi:hypothetical protein